MPVGIIRTIGEATECATSLPRKNGVTKPWQRAAKVLHEAAEHGGPCVFMARVVFCKAVHGEHCHRLATPKARKAAIGGSGSSRGIGKQPQSALRRRLTIR